MFTRKWAFVWAIPCLVCVAVGLLFFFNDSAEGNHADTKQGIVTLACAAALAIPSGISWIRKGR